MLSIRELRHAYGGRTVLSVPAWDVPRGAASLIIGPSGSGKSTLIAALCGLLTPSSGSVKIAGEEITALPAARRDRFRARHIGLIPQTLHLIPVLDVRGNLRLARRFSGLGDDDAWLHACLERLGISHLAAHKARDLSVGEAQRVAIARAVIAKPPLILADEPTSALDDANCERALQLLLDQAAACDATLVIATHDQRIRERFDRRLEL
jgi:putative ABC transport system ATP-binding protein